MANTYSRTVRNSANYKRLRITVEPGSMPYTTKVTFGNMFTVELDTEDALDLAEAIKTISEANSADLE